MNIIKYILGSLLILSGLRFMFNGSFLGGLLITLAGVALLPPISKKNQEKYPFWRKAIIRRSAIIFIALVGFGVAGSQFSDKDNIGNNVRDISNKKEKLLYSEYQNSVKNRVANFNEQAKALRAEKLKNLKNNSIYKILVDSAKVSTEYLPVLNAISNGITYINPDGFSINETLMKRVEKSENSNDKIEFILKTILIAQPQKGGLTNELINVFERYKNKYKYYGEPSTLYGISGKKPEKIKYNYDLSSIFAVLDPESKGILDAVYEARQKGYSLWNNDKAMNYTYNYISTQKGYNKHVKDVYPNSPYVINADIEISAVKLFRDYDANEVAADEKYKGKTLAVTGIIGGIGNDVFNDPYISLNIDILQDVNCYFDEDNKSVISKLRKGQKVTIIGVCKGKSLNIMVRLSDCKLWQ